MEVEAGHDGLRHGKALEVHHLNPRVRKRGGNEDVGIGDLEHEQVVDDSEDLLIIQERRRFDKPTLASFLKGEDFVGAKAWVHLRVEELFEEVSCR